MMDSHNRAAANDYNASSEPLNLLYLGLQPFDFPLRRLICQLKGISAAGLGYTQEKVYIRILISTLADPLLRVMSNWQINHVFSP
jgi:hypothetical protein